MLSASLAYAGWLSDFLDLFRSNEALVGKAYAAAPRVNEKVTCVFKSSTEKQACTSSTGKSCRGKARCTINIAGNQGERITWKSSCGEYAYTTMDGRDENAEFGCSGGGTSSGNTGVQYKQQRENAPLGNNPAECIPGQIIGDINRNGKIDYLDVDFATKIYLGTLPTPSEKCCVDTNKNNLIDIGDVQAISNMANGVQESPGVCAQLCTPKTCAELRKLCGTWDDGCGGSIDCGYCECVDSDVFMEPYTHKGNVTVLNYNGTRETYTDYCYNGSSLYEYSCKQFIPTIGNFNVSGELYRCPFPQPNEVCIKGACWDYFETPDDCMEVIPGHNDLNATDRVNVVFLGFNYPSIGEFVDRAVGIVNINGDGSLYNSGLLSQYPFSNYKNKFNLWYVNSVLPYDANSFLAYLTVLSSLCPHFSNQQKMILIKGVRGQTGANPEKNESTYSDIRDTWWLQRLALHEFGHSFGKLDEEYIRDFSVIENILINSPNCNMADETVACPSWCSGPPVPLENFKGGCNASDAMSCYNLGFCEWTAEEPPCKNDIDICLGLPEDKCKNSTYCDWANSGIKDPYFNSACIPKILNVKDFNIGTGCINNTGCYKGCGTILNSYRSSPNSIMRYHWSATSYGYVNERHLIGLLESLGSFEASSQELPTPSRHNIIFYDDFDESGKILTGGSINLDQLDAKATNEIAKSMKARTGKETAMTREGKIDSKKVSTPLLVEEYIKYQKKKYIKK